MMNDVLRHLHRFTLVPDQERSVLLGAIHSRGNEVRLAVVNSPSRNNGSPHAL